jgi:sugar lactone lactonase YvrE
MPDGMSIDSEDNLYICHWAGKISVWNKSLKMEQIIDFPVDQVCCGGFGGDTMQDFYVATARFAYTPKQMADRRGAGGLFKMSMKIPGKADNFFPIN